MSGVFRAGQLVQRVVWYNNDRLELTHEPQGGHPWPDAWRGVGYLENRDVAIVIADHRGDGSSVYVLGPHGGGWTMGALLQVVKETPVP